MSQNSANCHSEYEKQMSALGVIVLIVDKVFSCECDESVAGTFLFMSAAFVLIPNWNGLLATFMLGASLWIFSEFVEGMNITFSLSDCFLS